MSRENGGFGIGTTSDQSGVSLSLTEMPIRVLLILAPPALLSVVSRQMQRDASDVVYSAKNRFFVPLGSIDDDGWWCIPRPFPQVKRLDIAFDMQDITENIREMRFFA